eukprot:4365717-Pyramimonas_sp.AAC.1
MGHIWVTSWVSNRNGIMRCTQVLAVIAQSIEGPLLIGALLTLCRYPSLQQVVEKAAEEPAKKKKIKKGLFAALAAEFDSEEANKEVEAARWGEGEKYANKE